MTLTPEETARGWVEFFCPDHGFLVATTPSAVVSCKCGKRAAPPAAYSKKTAWRASGRRAPAEAFSSRTARNARHRREAEKPA